MYIFKLIQIFLTVIVTGLILLQSKGGGLSMSVGSAFTMYRSKRGAEKVIFILTIIFSVLVVANSLLIIITA